MIRIEPGNNRVQWTDDCGVHHVGRVMYINDEPLTVGRFDCVLVRLDHGHGDVIVAASRLRLFPDAPIPEPINQGAVR